MKHFSAVKIVIWLVCMFVVTTSAHAEDRWFFVGENIARTKFYMTPAAKPQQAWLKTIDLNKSYTVILQEFDCIGRRYQWRHVAFYSADGRVLSNETIEYAEWREVIPDTIAEKILTFNCELNYYKKIHQKNSSDENSLSHEQSSDPPKKNKTEPFRLPDNFIDCSKDSGEFCSSTELFDEMQKQLIDIDGSNTFYFRSRDDTLPYRLKRRVSEATDGQVPLTIYVDALWQGLRVKEIFGEYEGWGMSFDASLEDVREVLIKNGAQISSEGCGVHVFESDGVTNFYSGC